ncbi:hypothetical protein BU23DRAFT_453043 [Bimuria novae-zelandiae CBS 107.79]|uniref:Uncharacterized protein n=1 Tax=Bimuria novae-zelandiae CBS 107.79 TaxID=1447943 RepID=A0A6A5VVR9_9PLEO|nr:hypothetical protein BU23DRAFT_453043 [Bimuria novae-zelandiae CBS 107.79]
MKLIFTTSALLALCSAHPTRRNSSQPTPSITDVAIMQYALTLEHLENRFYHECLTNFNIEDFKAAGYQESFYQNLKEVSYDETTHVSFLTQAIIAANATPVEECTYTFGITDVHSCVKTAGMLEGVGVSAYAGAAASILEKLLLTTAASILAVEARHSSLLRKAKKQSPFPQPFDVPLSLDQVYTLAAPFIVSCPAGNGPLPVKAFPTLSIVPGCGDVATNKPITLQTAEPVADAGPDGLYYAAWISASGPTFVDATLEGADSFSTKVPDGYHGQSYVLLTKGKCADDDCVVAGPAIVEVQGAAGMA